MMIDFQIRQIGGGLVSGSLNEVTTLWLPKRDANRYSLAQIDNYMNLPRRKFLHKPPLTLQLEAQISGENLPGTWGFGLWNDPFSIGYVAGGMSRLLPVLPNATWFFYGSDENHLTLREGLPGQGFHAKTFLSPQWPSFVSLVSFPILPLSLCPLIARLLRRMSRVFIIEDGKALPVDKESWHVYQITWLEEKVIFHIDNNMVFSTPVSPQGRLGLVIWIDNQFMSFMPNGIFRYGSLPLFTAQQLQIRDFQMFSENLGEEV